MLSKQDVFNDTKCYLGGNTVLLSKHSIKSVIEQFFKKKIIFIEELITELSKTYSIENSVIELTFLHTALLLFTFTEISCYRFCFKA